MTPAPEKKQDRRPPYQHAADELRRDIKEGRIKPGEQMPSVRELQQRFGVANMTARNALNVLRDEGLIHTIHGRGSFVTDVGDFAGEFSIDYTPPAWYLAKMSRDESGDEAGGGEAGGPKIAYAISRKGEAGSPETAEPSPVEVLIALREEIRKLSADQQELRREIEALKKARQP